MWPRIQNFRMSGWKETFIQTLNFKEPYLAPKWGGNLSEVIIFICLCD